MVITNPAGSAADQDQSLLALAFSSHPPKRTQAEPSEGHCTHNCRGQPTASDLTRMVLAVLLERGSGKGKGHDDEKQSRDFEPKLVCRASERTRCSGHGAHHGTCCAAAPNLVLCYAGEHA